MSSSTISCANPECNEPGKLKCSGCASVAYCSPACQKKHWSTHKAVCKTLKANASTTVTQTSEIPATTSSNVAIEPSSAVPPAAKSELEIKFQAIQTETQKLFVAGKFTESIKSGMEALELAKQFPPHVGTTEIVQIHLNCSSAYMQMQKFTEAVEQAELAAQEAENGIKLRPGQPQAIEVLAITYGTKAFSLINAGKFEEASVAAEKSLAMAETIYPKSDPRLHKPLRALALVRERQGNLEEAEKYFFKSYTLLSLGLGPQSTEAQMSIDELCNMLLKKNDLASAEKFARLNYKAISEKTLDERGELILGDSASRLAQVVRRQGRFPEAEELLQQALKVREEKLIRNNPIGVAYTLSQLAAVQEAQGKVGADVEAKLMRALDIFGRVKGQSSPEVQSTLNQLRIVRSKRNNGAGPGTAPAAVTDEDGLEYSISSESKTSTVTTGSRAPASAPRAASGTTASPALAATGTAPASTLSDDEELARLQFGPEDGMGRMLAANTFFEQGRFNCAEVVITEALEIFMRQKGPADQLTMAARQNLNVARGNGLNKLWMQVVAELVLEQEEKLSASLSSKFTH